MTPLEKERTLRVLVARNRRVSALSHRSRPVLIRPMSDRIRLAEQEKRDGESGEERLTINTSDES